MDGLARIGNGQFVAAQQRSSSGTGLPDKAEDFGALVTDEPAPAATGKPNMIQFMAATGASVKEARDALYVHKNWQHYLPDWDGGLDTVAAYGQVKDELASGLRGMDRKWSAPLLDGSRSLDSETIGGTGAFRPLDGPMAGASGGRILPSFFDNPASSLHGRLASFAIMRADGSRATTIMPHNRDYGSTDPSIPFGSAQHPAVAKERFARDVFAFGLGQEALDDFARSFGADNWEALDWAVVQDAKGSRSNPLMKDDWVARHGAGSHTG
ncbi:hypothetical protein [Chelativorans multitrophicus]|uniref:hypothetical protein n=1 Tax=Chelativorans multitrophicus TaxID=449973 RepID=UPI00140ADF9C|nr:hypothetical protein [Chelativorans multitrophicus]